MLTNAQVEEALKIGGINITNYNPEHLGLYYYILTPIKVITGKTKNDDGTLDESRSVDLATDRVFGIGPKQNITVIFKENIILSKKYYGSLFSCSVCIESGLHLTFGDIEPEYKGEIRIGVTNMRDYEYRLTQRCELVKVRFEEFPENAKFSPLPAERKAHNEIIECLRGEMKEKEKLQQKTAEDIKRIKDRLAELSGE